MGLQLKEVVPLGRAFDEYVRQFALSEIDLAKKTVDCGGGPSDFAYEMKRRNHQVISIDPIYQFTRAELEQRINETFTYIIEQSRADADKYVWKYFKDVDDFMTIRMGAMKQFLNDFEIGKKEGRYITAALPALPFADNEFELALSSQLLFTYTSMLSLELHIEAIKEMLRVATEIRIYPLLDYKELNGNRSPYVDQVVQVFQEKNFQVSIETVDYEFQKGGNQFLKISK
jgi:ubiquinone/menaquinone biosynthesis C-methylase UbiE